MPYYADITPHDRALGVRTNTHPRISGDLIAMPDDILEGIGKFLVVDHEGNPVGWRLGSPEEIEGRHVYVGPTADSCTRQTHTPIRHDRPTHVIDYEIDETGPTPPDASSPSLARIPPALTPTLKTKGATTSGYPASTTTSPYWYAWAWYVKGVLTLAGPAVPFQIANGQSVRVPLPSTRPEGIHEVALLLSEPKRSRPDKPGKMRVQRIVDLRTHPRDTYVLSGPYRWHGQEAPSSNQTKLPTAAAPKIQHRCVPAGARPGRYYAKIVWTDRQGRTISGAASATLEIFSSNRYTVKDKDGNVTFRAGLGRVKITRPAAPRGATGWLVYLFITPQQADAGYSAGWRQVLDLETGRGTESPFPLSQKSVETAGWSGSEEYYGKNDTIICVDVDAPPSKNTTGVSAPEERPEAPIAFGLSRPPAGRLFVKTTDVVRGAESLPCPAVEIKISSSQVPVVVFKNADNEVPNPTFVETDADNEPLHWDIDKTGGFGRMEGDSYAIGTQSVQTGTTPSAKTALLPVDSDADSYIEADFDIEPPESGADAGSVEVLVAQIDKDGVVTESFSTSFTKTGEYRHKIKVEKSSSSSTQKWTAATKSARVWFRLTGSSKNRKVRIRGARLRRHEYTPPYVPHRRKKKPRLPNNRIEGAAPPRTEILDPPEPPWVADTFSVPAPFRPKTTGAISESLDFEAGLPAAPWASVVGGTATLAAAADAAIGGASGMKAAKATAGTAGTPSPAYIEKTLTSTGSHASGLACANRLAVAPSGGRIGLHALSRPSDKQNVAWLEASAEAEIVELTIEEDPVAGGNASVTLADAAAVSVPVSSVADVQDLTISAAPTGAGTVSVTIDDETVHVDAGGTQQSFTFLVKTRAQTSGYVALTVGGVQRRVYIKKKMSIREIATAIHRAGYAGYSVERVNFALLRFTAEAAGARPSPTFSAGTTRMTGTLTVQEAGDSETTDELAARIREIEFPSRTTGQGATPNVVRFTATSGGVRTAASYSAGTTGATGSFTSVTAGSLHKKEDVAATIRGMGASFTGWTLSGATNKVRFTATTAGLRQASTYRPGPTGADGTMRTIRQGSAVDLVAVARDKDGGLTKRKIMQALTSSTIFNTDVTVSGAGTDRAVVTMWGSLGANPLKQLARFEDVDLTGHPVGHLKLGVVSESSEAVLFELHVDTVSVTDRGSNWYRDHDEAGAWLPQVRAYYDPGQPVRQDLLLQDAKVAVIPGSSYTLSAFIYAIVDPNSPAARPLVATAHYATGGPTRQKELADVTGTTGLTGKTEWTQFNTTITIPDGCYAVSLRSKDIAAGAFAIQEVVLSPGTTPKRTGLYATSATYLATFDTRTPNTLDAFLFWTRERLVLDSVTDATAAGTSISVDYRSAEPDPLDPTIPDAGGWSAYTATASSVPDRAFVQARYTFASSDGKDSAIVRSGSPNAETVLKVGERRISTLLNPDRSELPGGSAFESLQEWSPRPIEARRRLPSGQLRDDPKLFEPVGDLPPSVILVFTDAARLRLERDWKEEFVIERHGIDAISVRLSEPPVFERVSTTTTFDPDTLIRHGVWRASLASAQVVKSVPLPR